MFSKRLVKAKSHAGFSMIEILITSAIIGVITAIIVIRYGAFNSAVLLRNQAYEIALAAREAQVFSISVRGRDSEFREEYGIYIDVSGGPTQELIMFLDTNDAISGPPVYDSGSDEIVERMIIDSRFEVYEICLGDFSSLNCSLDEMTITFQRPDFDAVFHATPLPSSRERATIGLRPIGDSSITRTVEVNATGLISVQ